MDTQVRRPAYDGTFETTSNWFVHNAQGYCRLLCRGGLSNERPLIKVRM
ncbi:MAG: hypothetical protein IJX63_01640 [Lachnospiraceae bacterium]|nr:hypothetical protein [Lachnospiraceae bacterium]